MSLRLTLLSFVDHNLAYKHVSRVDHIVDHYVWKKWKDTQKMSASKDKGAEPPKKKEALPAAINFLNAGLSGYIPTIGYLLPYTVRLRDATMIHVFQDVRDERRPPDGRDKEPHTDEH